MTVLSYSSNLLISQLTMTSTFFSF
uniref:Uncharacterized protein n=1 Tax=Anguilla anguilla TaxID=7936 RepID=A0A0E9P6I4_ANGAN